MVTNRGVWGLAMGESVGRSVGVVVAWVIAVIATEYREAHSTEVIDRRLAVTGGALRIVESCSGVG